MSCALPQVERDATVNKVILDEENASCFVRCAHGPRQSFKADHGDPFGDLFQTQDVEEITAQLCAKVNGPQPELGPFLNCTLHYLRHFAAPEDFHWFSLCRMAEALSGDVPIWDILMEDAATSSHPQANALLEYYQWFLEMRNKGTPGHIRKALIWIQQYVSQAV